MARRTNTFALAVGRRLTIARKASPLTLRELAVEAMCTTDTILRISHGRSLNPGAAMLTDLARALEVPPEWLICGVGVGPTEGK